MAFQNAAVAILAQGGSYSVQGPGHRSNEWAADLHTSSYMFDGWCHTVEPAFHLLNYFASLLFSDDCPAAAHPVFSSQLTLTLIYYNHF